MNNFGNNMLEKMLNLIMGVKSSSQPKEYRFDADTQELDVNVLIQYFLGTLIQIGAMIAFLWCVNLGFRQLQNQDISPWLINTLSCIVFAVFSIRSRVFSPLDNTRSRSLYDSIKRPSWAPPPLAFPLVWMSIAVLRVASSFLMWSYYEYNFLAFPLIIFAIHLALGDTWNTVFTVEGRLGFAVPVVILGPLLSAFVVTFVYWQTVPLAGAILFPSCLWLIVASALVYSIWQLNGQEPMYPLKR